MVKQGVFAAGNRPPDHLFRAGMAVPRLCARGGRQPGLGVERRRHGGELDGQGQRQRYRALRGRRAHLCFQFAHEIRFLHLGRRHAHRAQVFSLPRSGYPHERQRLHRRGEQFYRHSRRVAKQKNGRRVAQGQIQRVCHDPGSYFGKVQQMPVLPHVSE